MSFVHLLRTFKIKGIFAEKFSWKFNKAFVVGGFRCVIIAIIAFFETEQKKNVRKFYSVSSDNVRDNAHFCTHIEKVIKG